MNKTILQIIGVLLLVTGCVVLAGPHLDDANWLKRNLTFFQFDNLRPKHFNRDTWPHVVWPGGKVLVKLQALQTWDGAFEARKIVATLRGANKSEDVTFVGPDAERSAHVGALPLESEFGAMRRPDNDCDSKGPIWFEIVLPKYLVEGTTIRIDVEAQYFTPSWSWRTTTGLSRSCHYDGYGENKVESASVSLVIGSLKASNAYRDASRQANIVTGVGLVAAIMGCALMVASEGKSKP